MPIASGAFASTQGIRKVKKKILKNEEALSGAHTV